MAVEACRNLMRSAPEGPDPRLRSTFATATPPYLDKTNATVIHAALDLPSRVFAGDVGGAPRSVNAALRSALGGSRPTLVVAADVRTGRPGSSDEANTGDAAVAWLIGRTDRTVPSSPSGSAGPRPPRSSSIAGASPSGTTPGSGRSASASTPTCPWSPRRPRPPSRSASLEPGDIDAGVIAGLHARALRGAARAAGVDATKVVDDLSTTSSARPAAPTPAWCWPRPSTTPSRARRSWSSTWSTGSTSASSGPPRPSPRTSPRPRSRPRSRRGNDSLDYNSSSPGGASSTGSRPAGPIPSHRRRRRRSAPTAGSTPSSARGTPRAGPSTSRRSGCRSRVERSTRWSRSRWPTSRPPW